jgi:hypothetical protein
LFAPPGAANPAKGGGAPFNVKAQDATVAEPVASISLADSHMVIVLAACYL